uniref:hypothetical protein n=1 Tax=Roseivirga sp. TaxID=1964215 RepID=UPI004048A92C
MKKLYYFILLSILVLSCDPQNDAIPETIDQRQEMIKILDHTAKLVSHVMISSDARQELLGYAFQENAGEVEASFAELLSPTSGQRSLINDAELGRFAERFRPISQGFEIKGLKKSNTIDDKISDLESYLKENNLGIYGPYLAENHSNSTKPITVSFDPLDDTKTTNYGYRLIPKSKNGNSASGNTLPQGQSNFDNYDLEMISNIDDNYAMDNPVIVIVPLDGYGSSSYNNQGTGQTPQPIPNNGIICSNLRDGDLLRPTMARFRLLENLRSGFWNRNLMNMYAITKDDISFDANNGAVINSNVAKVWNEFRISRSDASDKKWQEVNTLLDSNWLLDEDNLFLAISYKIIDVSISEINVEIAGDFAKEGKPAGFKASAKLKFEEKQTLLYSFPFDKCATLALYKTASIAGLEQGLRIESGADKSQFTFNMEWYR